MKTQIFRDKDSNILLEAVRDSNNQLFSYYIIDTPLSKNLKAYYSIQQDLMECDESCKLLLLSETQSNPQSRIVRMSLLFHMITKYVRCFNSSSKGRGNSLDYKNVFKVETFMSNVHEDLVSLRNDYIAHAGESPFEYRTLFAYIDESKNLIEGIRYGGFKLHKDDENLMHYKANIEYVLNHVLEKIQKLTTKLNAQINYDFEFIIENCKTIDESTLIDFDIKRL